MSFTRTDSVRVRVRGLAFWVRYGDALGTMSELLTFRVNAIRNGQRNAEEEYNRVFTLIESPGFAKMPIAKRYRMYAMEARFAELAGLY